MQQVLEFFSKLFSPDSWPARWHCGRWTTFHGWLYILSNLLIAIAYFSIPVLLYYLIQKAKNKLPFQKVFWLFLLFILACGFTHVMDALMFWYPVYRVSAIVLFVTALISCVAVVGLSRVVPAALLLKSPSALEQIITERTAALESANRHLVKSNSELEAAQEISEKLMKQKDEFISVVSHELKTPVTSLKGYTQIMAARAFAEDGDQRNMLLKVDTQINKLTKLINDLLDTNKIQDGVLVYQMQKLRLDSLLEETIEQVQHTTNHKISIQNSEPLTVMADADRITQVINNLLTNAAKFSPGTGEVLVSLTRQGNLAVCCVQDFGFGIPKEKQQDIFEKFYRVDREQYNSYPGLGLGLYIVKDIILKHGGKIWLDSEVQKGSRFYFGIPLSV